MSKFREDQLVRYVGPVDRNLGHDGDLGVGEVGPDLPGGLRVDFEFGGMGLYLDEELEAVTEHASGPGPHATTGHGPATPFLVLVTGHAAAGKTTVAEQLATRLDAVWISRDAIHSMVYSGWRPQHPALTSERYDPEVDGNVYFEGGVVWSIFLSMLRAVAPRHTVVADTPFNHTWNREMFADTAAALPVPMIEVALTGDPDVLLDRARRRAATPGVHEIKARFSVHPERYASPYEPVLPATLTLHIDTTDLEAVNIDQIATTIQKTLGLPPAPQA